jgi:hypothetical protein
LDNDGSLLLKDSVLRDGWGYPGKIASIESYELAFPQLSFENGKIQILFKVFEQSSEDAIDGLIFFDVNSKKTAYEWRESISEP